MKFSAKLITALYFAFAFILASSLSANAHQFLGFFGKPCQHQRNNRTAHYTGGRIAKHLQKKY